MSDGVIYDLDQQSKRNIRSISLTNSDWVGLEKKRGGAAVSNYDVSRCKKTNKQKTITSLSLVYVTE